MSVRKHIVKTSPTLDLGRIKIKNPSAKINKHKKLLKKSLGTCYVEKNCVGVIIKKVTKTQY